MSGAEQDHPSSDETAGAEGPAGTPVERRGGRRRTYNRRSDEQAPSPPYFEVFERIASALERIEVLLRSGQVTLPDVETRTPANR